MSNRVVVSLCLLFVIPSFVQAQKLMSIKPKKPIVCYAKQIDEFTVLHPPEEYLKWKNNPSGRIQSATFDVTYVGFTADAKAAFQKAVDIWSTLITSTQTIHVYAEWSALQTGILGSAIWGNAFANFPGAQQVNTYYPVALAEKMARQDLNASNEPDIVANFSSVINWSYNTDGTPASGKYDLTSVVLHELGHGLGFVDSYTVSGTEGSVGVNGSTAPMIYDLALENNSNQNLFQSFISPSTNLETQLTSNALYLGSSLAVSANSGSHAKIYAPSTFSSGSSISHLDETKFPAGNINSLMSPQIGAAEVMHDPGPIVKGLFSDMGWVFTSIEHDSLRSRENIGGPFVVKAKIVTEAEPVNNIKLIYNSGGSDTEVAMTATGLPNEYSASIPSTGVASTYAYYISVNDNLRNYTSPGKLTQQGVSVEQTYYIFKTGPDTQAPVITHSPKKFILNTDTQLDIASTVKDNIGVESVQLDYFINDVAQPVKKLFWNQVENDLYTFTLSFAANSLAIDDVIKYRITARDTATIGSASGNLAYSPSVSTYHTIKVLGLQPTQDNYVNDFNSTSADFFGDGFKIDTPNGFDNGAIQSDHPYLEGNGYPNNERSISYELLVPIKVKAVDATVKFDEIVLVEPGDTGSNFGDSNFYDYVIVEGSTDGGSTWKALADGYDCQSYSDWLTKYNSSMNGSISTAVGDPALYKTRIIDMLNSFTAGEEVILRFRLYSDAFGAGWGWAIDNLKIQIDETPPKILHDHTDYLFTSATVLPVKIKVTDGSGVESLSVEYGVNGEAIQTAAFTVDPNVSEYTFNLELSNFSAGDKIQYRIIAKDKVNNEGALPASGLITTTIFSPATAVDLYVNNFDSASDDFVGNFFSIATPSGFTSACINTEHSYLNGFGFNLSSSYAYMLTKPIILNADNPYIKFDEIAIVEGHTIGTTFNSADFNDYVVVEGSKDGGITWQPFLDGYDAASQSTWLNAFNNGADATKSMFKSRVISMLSASGFAVNDHVLVRFRLYANETKNGWGWAIDNLSIQGPVTAVDESNNVELHLYPNPAKETVTLDLNFGGARILSYDVINTQGQSVSTGAFKSDVKTFVQPVDIQNLPSGLYVVKVHVGDRILTKKFVKEK